MARSEARIFTSIWKDEDFVTLPASAQWVYMFLLSQPELTYCGVMPLRVRRWVPKAAGLTLADIERDLKELEGTAYPSAHPSSATRVQGAFRRPFVITDPDTGEIFVRSLLRRDNAWKQPNLLKQAMDASDEIESPRILRALLAEVRRLPVDESPSEQVRTLIAQWVSDLEHGTPHPSAYPPPHPPPNPPDNPEDDRTAEGGDDPSDNPTGNDRAHAGSSNPPSPSPPSPSPPTSLPAQDRKLGTRLPDDFEEQIRARPDLADWFRKNCPHVDGKWETERFRDHWAGKAGKDGRKVDWIATWRNWMRTAEDRARPRVRSSPPPSSQSTSTDRAVQAVDAGRRVQKMIDEGKLTI